MPEAREEPLQAAAFRPQDVEADPATPETVRRPAWLLPGIGVLVVTAILVFGLLPLLFAPDDPAAVSPPPAAQSAEGNLAAPGASATSPSERSPFAEAQEQKLRKAAQDALQTVLEIQQILVDFGVESWAPDAYASALEAAQAGDLAYRERRFTEAAMAYQEAGTQLAALEDSIPERAARALGEVRAAIEAGDTAQAVQQKSLLDLLRPGDPELDRLAGRIEAIPAVSAALDTARGEAAAGQTRAAVNAAEDALAADPDHQRAAAELARYREADATARFRSAMSAGYAALEQEAFDKADEAFRRAAAIRPGAAEPGAGQQELAAARTAAELRKLATDGAAQETAEAWDEAVATYQQALTVDSTLVYARDGLSRAEPRAALAKGIRDILNDRDRLVDPRALRAAEDVLAEAAAIQPKGPVLTAEVAELTALLDWARTPVSVSLSSDNLTDVTVLRVQRLGSFSSSTLSLRPGRYTALGVRNGYRDVRIDFDVKPGAASRVDVRCEEAI